MNDAITSGFELKGEMREIRPANSAKQEEEGGIGADFAEDSPHICRRSSATLVSVPIPARKSAPLQLFSTKNRNSNESDRNDTRSGNRNSKVSNPSKKSQAISVAVTSSQSAEPHLMSRLNGAPRQPDTTEVLRGYSGLHTEYSTYAANDSESNASFDNGTDSDVLLRLPFASAALGGSEDSMQPMTSSLREERNENVSEPQAKGCETFRPESVNFAYDWSYQSFPTAMAPSVNSVRSANTKKSGIDSTFRAEYGEEARLVNKSAEDSNPFSQAGSASLYSERLSAENNTLIQLNSQHVQGTSTDRDVPGSEGFVVKGSQPLKEARCILLWHCHL